jgi:hypothetical protein
VIQMKGIMARQLTAVGLTAVLALGGGCEVYRNLVDPCYPERYESMARHEVSDATAPQINNGHVLDQTVWNYHFEPGTDKLTKGGLEHLAYLARRRPCPDGTIFLQTAQDVDYDQAAPDKFAKVRADLDRRRTQAVQNYLAASTAGRQLAFAVVIHDPSEVGLIGNAAGISVMKLYPSFQGSLPSATGGAAGAPAGGSGGGAGGAAGGAGGGAGK